MIIFLEWLYYYHYYFLFADKNECSDPNMCLHGVCQNYRGGYQCLCNPGFVVTEDLKDCVGQYQCATSPGIVIKSQTNCS